MEDIAGFAAYIADKDFGLGEDYNVVDDSIVSYYEFTRYLALLLGRNMFDLPVVSLKRVQPHLERLARVWLWLEKSLGLPRERVFEIGSTAYISSSYWLTNQKSKDAFPNDRTGMKRNSLRLVVDAVNRALQDTEGIG